MGVRALEDAEALTASRGALLIGFWAQWCQPSHALAETLEALAEQRPELRVVMVDLDRHPDLRERYALEGLPSVLLYDGERLVLRRTGLLRRDALLQLVAAA